MWIALTIIGGFLITLALRDLFHTLFHPASSGDINDWLTLIVWKIFHWIPGNHLTLAGPLSFLVVVSYWAASLIVGFALIYWPHLTTQYVYSPGVNPATYNSFLGALNVSLASLITLATAAIAKNLWLQLLMGLEALFGFGLLTGSISWILSIYPVLEHRRSLAHQGTLLHFAETIGKSLENLPASEMEDILLSLATQLTTYRNELSQFPITYYFHDGEDKSALAGVLPYLADLADQNVSRDGAIGVLATALGGAIDDYLKLIAGGFLKQPFTSRSAILEAYAADHRRKIVRAA